MTVLQEKKTGNLEQYQANRTQESENSILVQKQEVSSSSSSPPPSSNNDHAMASFVRSNLKKEISQQVVRKKLAKLRHLVLKQAISPEYLDSLFPSLLEHFDPQHVIYNGGIANITEWKISCYLEVMEGGVPTANPNIKLLDLFRPLLDECNQLFLFWFRQKSACNNNNNYKKKKEDLQCSRLMTFITRYTPAPGEEALLKHVDGSGKVDGSVVVALPIDRWSAPESVNSFIGHGGGLTFWDGKNRETKEPNEIHYETSSGDLAFIDRAVWHQADPITKGTRWALVIFYKVHD